MNAPSFSLPDQNGNIHTLESYKGRWLLLYFYPKDDTPGCTKEACSFRDLQKQFDDKNCEVVGISKDSVRSHKKFGDKYNLPFTLLSDETREVINAYHSWGMKKFMGREFEGVLRNTVLISPDGEIVKEYKGVDVMSHAKEVLEDLESLQR